MRKEFFLMLLPCILIGQVQIGQDLNGEGQFDLFGVSTSISANGNVIAIGANANDDNATDAGHVRVFELTQNEWTQIGQDIDGDDMYDQFGYSISLSDDGNTLAVSTFWDLGYTRIFENSGGAWTQIGDDIIGHGVHLSNDGGIVAVGYVSQNGVGVYENVEGEWVQIGNIIEGQDPNGYPGAERANISFSNDNKRIAIGAPKNNNDIGQVRIFENIAEDWVQVGNEITGASQEDKAGFCVSLSGDGNIVAIGYPNSPNGTPESRGHARIYKNVNDGWVQIGETISGEDINDQFGFSVSLSNNGNILAIGAIRNNGGNVRIFQNIEDEWIQIGETLNGQGQNDFFGFSVSLSRDGKTIAVGAPKNNDVGPEQGQVTVYNLSDILSIEDISLENDILIFPNPTSSIIKVDYSEILNIENVMIYDIQGKLIKEETKDIIDISDLPASTYIIRITTNKEIITRKIVVK